MKNYKKLEKIFARVNDLKKALELIQIDTCVGGFNSTKARISQMITIKSLIHEILTSVEVQELIVESSQENLDEWQKVNFVLIRNFCATVSNVPFEVSVELIEKSTFCYEYFKTAKRENNPKLVMEHFKALLEAIKKIATGDENKYDQLLRVYQINSEQIDELCLSMGPFLKLKIGEIKNKDDSSSKGNLKKVCDKLSIGEKIQFSFADASYVYGDDDLIRIVTREETSGEFLSNALYLLGQAIYLQNLPHEQWRNQPICSPASLSMYSAQGFLFSHFLLEDKQVIKMLGVKEKKAFDKSVIGSNKFVALTHLMIRFSLEKSLINGEISVDDLESAFKDDMQYYFNDSSADLLDNEEWFMGKFCYYPCYLKGMIIAGQIFHMIKTDGSLWPKNISGNSMKRVFATLTKNIYSLGARYSTNDLVTRLTGEPLDCRFFKKFE